MLNVWLHEDPCVGNSPHVQHVRVGPGFSVTAWFLSDISKMERQSYDTTERCLHGTAASMDILDGSGYSLDGPFTKPGIWFMGQFCVGRESVSIHPPLPLALMG